MTIKSTYDISDSILKGRGAVINPSNRFENTDASSKIQSQQYDEQSIYKTKVIETKAKSIINKVLSKDVPMAYSMNPYQGCEHGCIYCYARNTHNYWGYSSGLDFESKIIVKTNAADLLRTKLKSKNWEASPIMVSGNTDCYQPVEKTYKITRKILKVMLDFKHPIGLITKNNLILRDLDIIKKLAKDNLISVAISINTLDDKLRQKLEPRASSISQRLKLIKTLVDNGISVTALAAPIIPGLNESEIIPLVKKLSELGVSKIGHIVVRLNGDIAELFEDWLIRHYPQRADKVLNKIKSLHGGKLNDSRIGDRMSGEGNIAEIIHQQFKLAQHKYLNEKSFSYNLDLYHKIKNPQLKLF
ncbi:MAG: PA0069 family radical SAM protein [Saprospiraceae bacterium]|nr:PA0069 family radical SAM protein [Saprospiraceae bacterium]